LNVLSTDFAFVRCDDSERNGPGGGVLCLIPLCLNHREVVCYSDEYIEAVVVDIFVPEPAKLNFRLILVYRSPSPNKSSSTEALLIFFS
jgi:hypothetical protein